MTIAGAVFLMATSAIGPGFITQTTSFTAEMGASFAFAIAVSIIIDIILQLNVWRIIGISGLRAQEIGNLAAPGLGRLMAVLLIIGGFVFNIGNISGTALGMNAMFGLDPKTGGLLSAVVAVAVFLSRRAGIAMDSIVLVLGGVMIALIAYVAVVSKPPIGEALKNVVLPEQVSILATTTLIGGTIGGYMLYAGAHRLLDSGIQGPSNIKSIARSSVTAILVTGALRVLLFLAILGVVATGFKLNPDNQTASAFQHVMGDAGMRIFGLVFWAAAISSVIGAAYTSITFVTSRTRTKDRTRTALSVGFIVLTTAVFLSVGAAPTTLLIFAGAFNGILLPVGIGALLWAAWRRPDMFDEYRYPRWLLSLGGAAWMVTAYLAIVSINPVINLFD